MTGISTDIEASFVALGHSGFFKTKPSKAKINRVIWTLIRNLELGKISAHE